MKNIMEQWNQAAQAYAEDQERSAFAESNKHIVKDRFQDMTGMTVLDLGCGYGWYTDYFRSIGADVVGVDGAEDMLRIARERYPHSIFEMCNIARTFPFADASFDLVFCNQVLMDIEDIDPVFAECHRILKPRGTLYYSIVHPAFYASRWLKDEHGLDHAKAVASYLTPCALTNTFWGETTHFHRPLSYYLNAAAEHGFILRRADEPVSYDGITKNADIPLFFFAEYQKE